ncbi:MAG: glycine betaine ABC transporter substrate-binding protein [Anaerolineales bacterium]|nr:glycine betaine ABC transporter substrate-binding protein [Anaerolineales bacterium]
MRNRLSLILGSLVIAGLLLSACGGAGGGGPEIRVGSKEFTEQHLLGNMYEMLLDDAGYNATYSAIGGSAEVHSALVNGEIDVYPEYTGTGLLTHLEQEYDPSMSGEDVYQTVKQQYQEQWDLTWLDPVQFNNTYCLAMPQERAEELGIETISDLTEHASELELGATQEFLERSDGLPGLEEAYGSFNFEATIGLDPGLKYSGLREGEFDVTTCFGTDGQIAGFNLRVLEDNQNFWPPYPAAPVIRDEVLEEHPEVADILNQLSPLLDGQTMSDLNWQVDGEGREADTVAREFLTEQGLLDSE